MRRGARAFANGLLGALPPLVLALACGSPAAESPREGPHPPVADVVSVLATGEPGAYRFEVGIESPDEGCRQYADWWEVVNEEGRLVHRRVLGHSHVTEQPFVRAGGPLAVEADTVVWVRAHMHPTGYGGAAFKGSVRDGFAAAELPATFASELADRPPRPPDCAN